MMSMTESIIKQNTLLDGLSIGRLLGKGKYCHVYMCQEKRSHFVSALKYIFKQEFPISPLHLSINNSLKLLMDLDHPSVTSVYKVIEDRDKISILQEYLPTLLYD
jgi:serine/threonine protein kinase